MSKGGWVQWVGGDGTNLEPSAEIHCERRLVTRKRASCVLDNCVPQEIMIRIIKDGTN